MPSPFYMNPTGVPNLSNPWMSTTRQPYMSPVSQTPVNVNLFPAQQVVPQSNIIWVEREEDITNYPSGKGWQQLFGDKNKNMFYIRETDLNGITQPIKRLSYTVEESSQPQQPIPDGVVTKDEFNELSSAVKDIADKLSELLK